ncbi:MAG: hypothetical protein LBD67_06540 [Candidatus Accumulibacter sp.]|nr:hypothetical protein [Accumulibacter sp.]
MSRLQQARYEQKQASSMGSSKSTRAEIEGVEERLSSPFVLSLSKYERTLRGLPNTSLIRGVQAKGIPGLSNPYPSTSFLRQAQDGAGRTDWKELS